MGDRAMREITHMRATIAAMREPVFACYRSAMMGEALRCRTRVSDVTGMRDMSGAPRVDRASMRAADVTGMHPATVTDMHPATVSDMRAAAVPGKTAEMRRPAGMHTSAPKVGRTTATKMRCRAAKMRCRAAKVGAATTEMRYPAAAKVRATTTAKVRATAATTEMRRSHRERKGGNAESQSGRQSSNNPTRHSTTPTI